MKKYRLGLETGGLQEDPEWKVQDIETLKADSLDDAKREYAKITGLDQKPDWNPERLTYWGWHIVEVTT